MSVALRAQHTSATYPSFACVLDDQPLFTAPSRLIRRLPASTVADAVPAPGLILTHTDDLGLPAVCSRGSVAVIDTGGGTSIPFWLGPEGLPAVQTLLRSGSTALLPARWRHLLVTAGLAVDPSETTTPCWPPTVTATEAHGKCPSFTPVRMALHPYHLGALRLHVRRLLRVGVMRERQDGDGQTPTRWIQHNDPVARWIQGHLTRRVSHVAGTPVTPSYTHTVVYHDGADLPAHVDQEREYTLLLCVDCLPEPPNAVPWPLILETGAVRVSAYLGVGDALLFRGNQIHGRPRLSAGLAVTNMAFHFVENEYR